MSKNTLKECRMNTEVKRIALPWKTLTVALLLSGCALLDAPGSQIGHQWELPAGTVEFKRHEWHHVNDGNAGKFCGPDVTAHECVRRLCSFKYQSATKACSIRLNGHPDGPTALIFATMSEADARNTPIYSITGRSVQASCDGTPDNFWKHEVVCHGFKGYVHPVTK